MKSLTQHIEEKLIINNDIGMIHKPTSLVNLNIIIDQKILDAQKKKDVILDCSDIDVSNIKHFISVFDIKSTDNEYLKNIVIIDVSRWKVDNAKLMKNMFRGLNNLEQIRGIEDWRPNDVTSFVNMFRGCERLNIDINNWDPLYNADYTGMFYNFPKKSVPRWIEHTKQWKENANSIFNS